MSTFSPTERRQLEKLFEMEGGHVLDFSHSTLAGFVVDSVGLDIHATKYCGGGTSKANLIRTLWRTESDYTVGKLILALVEHAESLERLDAQYKTLAATGRQIANRLLAAGPDLHPLKEHAQVLDAHYLHDQIQRMQSCIETDPALAIGTAKELIETCCKTILAERGKQIGGSPEVSTLTKETLKELKLIPDGVPEEARGADAVKRILRSLGSIGNDLAELRGLYGTGHGKDGRARGLTPRHAKLAVGAATTLVTFLFDTHRESKP